MAGPSKYTEEQYDTAIALIAEGASIGEAADTVGIPYGSLYQKIRRQEKRSDPKPGGRKSTKKVKETVSDEQLSDFYAQAASLPAIPVGLLLHCDFCANHFAEKGPAAAAQLVALSSDHPALRSIMEKIYASWTEAAWAMLLVSYVGVPVAHHAAPDFLYRWLQFPLGLPPKNQPHSHDEPFGSADPEAAAMPFMPTPFAGMDMESILRMAEGFGIKIDLPADIVVDATATETADTAEEPVSPTVTADADALASVTADTDTGE